MEKKETGELEKKQGCTSSDFSNETKKGLWNVLKTNVTKYVNPEKYFLDVLEKDEFEELKTLVEDSKGRISWEKLKRRGVVRIENRRIEGIYWDRELDLIGTTIKSLGKLKRVGGYLNCKGVQTLENLGELEEIQGDCVLEGISIKTLGKLKKIEGYLDCEGIQTLEDLGDLEEVRGDLILIGTAIRSLGKLKKIKGYLNCQGLITLKDLGELKEISSDISLVGTKVESLGKLKYIGGYLDCENLEILKDLGELEEVGGDLTLIGTAIRSLGNLKKVGGDLNCIGVISLINLGVLEEVGGDLILIETAIRSLGKLKKVGGDLNCGGIETLEDLGELEEVLGTSVMVGTSVEVQKKLIERLENENISLGTSVFGGEIKGIEELFQKKEIPGPLSVVDLPLDIQIKVADIFRRGELKLTGNLQFGGNIKGIEKLLDHSIIPGEFHLQMASFVIQMEMLYKIIIENIKIKNLEEEDDLMSFFTFQDGIVEKFNKLYENGKLNYKGFQEMYGEDIKQIEDEEQIKYAEKILRREYRRLEEEVQVEGNRIREENEGKELTEEKQAELREEVKRLVEKLKKEKEKIENLGIKL